MLVTSLSNPIYSSTTLLFSYIFFFSSHRAHLDLHSFPTRRSSDLSNQRTGRFSDGRVFEKGVASARLYARLPQWQADGDKSRDRKSTRLNSSHRCISYAVFCLKKKKKKTIKHNEQPRTIKAHN